MIAPRFLVALFFASTIAVAEIHAPERHATTTATPSPPSPDTVFRSEVRPILAARCAPCHEPGGKLYAKLPFDDPAVLASHVPGVKKRLKGDDLKTFERWIAMAPGTR